MIALLDQVSTCLALGMVFCVHGPPRMCFVVTPVYWRMFFAPPTPPFPVRFVELPFGHVAVNISQCDLCISPIGPLILTFFQCCAMSWNGMEWNGISWRSLGSQSGTTDYGKKNLPTSSRYGPLSARVERQSHPLAGQAQACGRPHRWMDTKGPDSTCRGRWLIPLHIISRSCRLCACPC